MWSSSVMKGFLVYSARNLSKVHSEKHLKTTNNSMVGDVDKAHLHLVLLFVTVLVSLVST